MVKALYTVQWGISSSAMNDFNCVCLCLNMLKKNVLNISKTGKNPKRRRLSGEKPAFVSFLPLHSLSIEPAADFSKEPLQL